MNSASFHYSSHSTERKLAAPLAVIGASGHGKVVADAAAAAGFEVIGHFDDIMPAGDAVAGRPRLGPCAGLPELLRQHPGLALALGVGDNSARLALARRIAQWMPEIHFPAVIHPAAMVSPSASIGAGTVILAGAIVNAAASLDDFVIVNSGAVVEHDCSIGLAASLAPKSAMGGGAALGAGSALMMGALLRHRIRVGDHTVVGMGSIVLADLPANVVAWGNPARVMRQRSPEDTYL